MFQCFIQTPDDDISVVLKDLDSCKLIFEIFIGHIPDQMKQALHQMAKDEQQMLEIPQGNVLIYQCIIYTIEGIDLHVCILYCLSSLSQHVYV